MRPSGQIMFVLLLRASARDAEGNEAEAEQGEHSGLGDSDEEILLINTVITACCRRRTHKQLVSRGVGEIFTVGHSSRNVVLRIR